MPGGGSIQGMINSLSNNKKLLRSKRLFSKEKTFLSLKQEYLKAADGKIDFKKATPEQLESIRKKLIKEKKKEALLFIGILVIVIGIFSYVGFKLMQPVTVQNKTQQIATFKKKETKYLFFIEKGDEWFKKGRWHNAIFNYKDAKALFPNDYSVNYRLVNAYSLQCEQEFKNCHTAKTLLDTMLAKHPNKQKALLEIKNRLEYEY
tara:strand:- start:17335 stop:17949 length:615 start_codon:yes stop_codon:yes gene_type:complete